MAGETAAPLEPLHEHPTLFGAPSRFGADNVVRGLGSVRTGQVVNLNLPLDDPIAPFNRSATKRSVRLHNQIRPGWDGTHYIINDDEISFALQGSSQWDSYAHFGVVDPQREGVYHAGFPITETYPHQFAPNLGIQALGPAIIGRGVLLDAVGAIGPDLDYLVDEPIDRAALERCLAIQDVAIEPGDVVLIYTGMERRRIALEGQWPRTYSGLTPDTVPLLEGLDILALALDNPGIDIQPGESAIHSELLNRRGIPLGELWALDDLAQACRADGQWDFLLVGVPLNLNGAFGSTANAVAVR